MSLTLREYQKKDLVTLIENTNYGIFNEQRTGKTPTTIMATQALKLDRVLIVCPASLLYVWQEEWYRWTQQSCEVCKSTAKILGDNLDNHTSAWIISYETLRGHRGNTDVLKYIMKHYKPQGLIVDEVHRCKDRDTLNFRAINSLSLHIPVRYYLTGTPAPNAPYEVWSILHFIAPKTFTSFWKFADTYFHIEEESYNWMGDTHKVIGTCKDKEALAKLIAQYSIQRKRRDVMSWLPTDVSPTSIRLPATSAQLRALQSLKKTFEFNGIECQGVLDSLVRTRQICNLPQMFGLKGSNPKIEWLKQYVSDYPNKQILLFSSSTKMLLAVSDVLQCPLIIGQTDTKKRKTYVDAFQAGIVQILGIQTQAGKEGLTLDKADVTIFIDTYPPAADYQQAKDRMIATAPNRVKPQEIIHLMIRETYDEQLYALVEQNIKDTQVINDYIKYMNRKENVT